jgi:intracellular septation protein
MRLGAFFFEIMPLAGFFIGFHYYGLGLAWLRDRYVAPFPLFSLLLSAGFTAAALLFDAAIFIKIQPTIFNGLFAAVLLGGLLMKRAMMQVFFAKKFFLTDDTWFRLSRRWGWFFLALAIANELVWRHASDAHWVAYKTFIAAPASVLFMLAQLPLTLRGRVAPSKPDTG